MRALGIDPDTKTTGWAVVEGDAAGFRVVEVGLVRAKGRKVQDRLADMARGLLDWAAGASEVSLAAVEWQRLRPRGEKNPNSIVDLNGVAGMCAACVVALADTCYFVTPSEWKGQVPKKIMHRRILRKVRLGDVDIKELDWPHVPASMRTHVIDAIGLACWALEQQAIARTR